MATTKVATVQILCNTTRAVQMLNEYKRLAEETLTEIEDKTKRINQIKAKGKKATADEVKEMKLLGKEVKEAEQKFNAYNSATVKGIDSHRKLSQIMKDLSGTKVKDLKFALRDLNKMMGEVSSNTPKRAEVIRRAINSVQNELSKTQGAMGTFGAKHESIWKTAVRNITAYVGVFGAFNMIKNKLTEIISLNLKFSDQMANIRKVSGLTMSDIAQLTKSLAKIDTRSTIQELNDLAYTGSKLGFGQYGTEGLESFVKSALKVQNALKEDMGEDAMTALSKMVEVMGLIPKMGVERAMDATGSAIFKLASTSTATGSNIVEFSKRLMGLANIAGISVDELLAFGSAADSMALMPEVAATAFNKLITAVQKQPNLIENALHMEPGTINDLYKAGKITDAIVQIFEAMRDKGGMNALMHAGVFKDLGSDGARLVAVMATMANRVDILNQHLATSRQAFAEATAVEQEYAIQMETAAAYMERASNFWTKAFVNPEGVDMTKDFAKAWYDVSKALTQTQSNAIVIRGIMTGIFGIMKLIVQLIPSIIAGFTAWGVSAAFTIIGKKLKELGGLVAALSKGIKSLSVAGWAGIITGVAFAVYGLYSHIKSLNEELKNTGGFLKDFKKDLSDLNIEYGKDIARLNRYKKAIDDATLGTKQRVAAIATFNKEFGQYMSKQIQERSTVKEIANAYWEVVAAMRAKRAMDLKQKDIEQQVATREGWAVQRREEYVGSIKGSRYEQYGRDWITAYAEQNRGKKLGDVAKDLASYFGISAKEANNMLYNLSADDSKNRGLYTDEQWMVRQAMRYIAQDRAALNAQRIVDAKWKPEQARIDEYNAKQQEQFENEITDLENAPDKDALKKAKQAETEYKQAIRKELQDAERESDAIMSKIEEWYRLQETVITGYAADGVWTQEKADQMIASLNIAKNKALADARRGISGRDEKSWQVTKQRIGDLMFDTSDMSKHLLEAILDVKLENVRTALGNIDKAGIEGITSTAMRDKLNKNAAGNDREIQRILRRASKEVEQMLLQYDFLEQAIRAFDTRLEKLGLLTESAASAARRIQNMQGTDQQKADAETAVNAQRRDAKQQAALNFISNGVENFKVDYNDTDALTKWLREFTSAQMTEEDYLMQRTPGFSKWAEVFKEDFQLWLSDSKKYKQDIQAFYLSLVNAEEIYYKKRKESFDFYKQQQEQYNRATGRTDSEDRQIDVLSNRSKQQDTGIGATFWQQQGLGTIANDPEVQMIQTRIYYRNLDLQDAQAKLEQKKKMQEQEIADMQAAGATEEAIRARQKQMEQERMGLEDLVHEREKAKLEQQQLLATKVAQEMQKRIQTINSLVKPVETAAKSIGQKFGDMIFDMESEESTWEQIWKNMALAVAESMLSMISQYAQNAIAKQAINKAEISDEATKAQAMTMLGISEGASKTIGTLGWWGIALIPVITALLMGLLTSALSTANSGNKSKPKTKVATGMLTYDEGNVQTVVGDDGHVYHARTQQQLPDGVSVVRHPIATTVNGQQALVGERGPEIVIGRRTTRNIQMNRPDLLRQLALIDRGITTRRVRTFDEGNISDLARAITTADAPATDAATAPDEERAALMQQMQQMQQVMQGVMHYLQNPVAPNINMFGDGGLHSKMKQADAFMKQYGD